MWELFADLSDTGHPVWYGAAMAVGMALSQAINWFFRKYLPGRDDREQKNTDRFIQVNEKQNADFLKRDAELRTYYDTREEKMRDMLIRLLKDNFK